MDTQSFSPDFDGFLNCQKCGVPPLPGSALRRGRCRKCYDVWLKERPIGVGAYCGGCSDQRKGNLQYFEVGLDAPTGGRWAILCHTCAIRAERLSPQPRTVEGLHMQLGRDRRWRSRRLSQKNVRLDRRDAERRIGLRDLFDASELVEELLELEADYEEVTDDQISCDDPVTGIHVRLEDQILP